MARPTVGSQVSHYRLERVLGAGGMGQVFLARDLSLDRWVAIKFLIAPEDEHARRRLVSEARAAAALDHPSICTVHEVVTDDESGDFIVMQFVEGESLAARIRKGRIPASEAVAIITPLLQALTTAHRAGVVHRDIKPQNIILTAAGQPKLLDFGIAKRVQETGSDDETTVSQLTGEGDVTGTLAYMSPEQVQGRPIDARTDLFSLGIVFYECLTGVRAFTGASRAETIGQLLHVEPRPPSVVVADLGPQFDTLCADLLKKNPSERFQSADEVLGAIRSLSTTGWHGEAGVVAPTRTRWSGRTLGVAGVAVAAVALAVWAWSWGAPLPEASPEAMRWFTLGVEKIREGSYAGARSALDEALTIDPDFVQAHLRLAEAKAELDDGQGAQEALLRVNALIPSPSRLPKEDQLRLDAVRSSVLRDHEHAIATYLQLAERAPDEASRWLDVGRAEDDAGLRVAAMAHFERAVSLDSQYAAAHQRLGVLQSQGGNGAAALASLDEAIRLHHAGANIEGEAEATLRRAMVHTARREFEEARRDVDRVDELAADPGYVSLRLRAQFERARISLVGGQLTEAETLGRAAVDEALPARMLTIASDGLRGLAAALISAGRFEDADAQLNRAIGLAQEQKASRAEMQARLQQASLRGEEGKYAEAIDLAQAPLKFFSEAGRYPRNEAEAKSILARAHEALEHYDEAHQLASEVLTLATALDDQVLVGLSLDNLAGQAERLGQLPEALALRERLEAIHRGANDHVWLAFDLVNRADLLIRLGRGQEGEAALDEVDRAIAAEQQAYLGRKRRVAMMRALRASIDGHFDKVEHLADLATDLAAGPSDTALFARVLAEHARAQLGRSRAPVDVMAAWPAEASTPALNRELAYWVGRTLVLRRRPAQALALAEAAWSAAPARTNLELRWRLAAVVAQASQGGDAAHAAAMREAGLKDYTGLVGQWGEAGVVYGTRPDLIVLRKGLQ